MIALLILHLLIRCLNISGEYDSIADSKLVMFETFILLFSILGSFTRDIWRLLEDGMGAEMCHNCDDDKIRRKVKGECI